MQLVFPWDIKIAKTPNQKMAFFSTEKFTKIRLNKPNNLYLIFLSLFSIIFVNVFFYRLAEHGTDRSAMILIMVLVIETLYLINLKEVYEKDKILKLIILISIIFSLKTFYIIYCILFLFNFLRNG